MTKLESLLQQHLKSGERVLNIRIPTYDNIVERSPRLDKLKSFDFTEKNGILACQSPVKRNIIAVILLIIKFILYPLECIFNIPLTTSVCLVEDALRLGESLLKQETERDYHFFHDILRIISITKNSVKKYKKLKTVLYIHVNSNTTKKTLYTIQMVKSLIEQKHITNAALVVLSEIRFDGIKEIVLELDTCSCNNMLIHKFGRNIFQNIYKNDFAAAERGIREILTEWAVSDVDVFDFIMQCLSFAYAVVNEGEFYDIFAGTSIKPQQSVQLSIEHELMERHGIDNNMLRFHLRWLEYYYRERHSVSCSEPKIAHAINDVYQRTKDKLIQQGEYFWAAELFAKYAPLTQAIDLYIVAFMHMEYIKTVINDECLHKIEYYANLHMPSTLRGELFLKLWEMRYDEVPKVSTVEYFCEHIKAMNDASAEVKLCFLYLLTDLAYKSQSDCKAFMHLFLDNLLSLSQENTLYPLFVAQFILYYSTVENKSVRVQYDKFIQTELEKMQRSGLKLWNKKFFWKICRCINGLRINSFKKNLEFIQQIPDNIKAFPFENIYYLNNLGVLYICNGDFNAAMKIFNTIDMRTLQRMPLCMKSSYINNSVVCNYLRQPSKKAAATSKSVLSDYLKNNYSDITTEETKHIELNCLLLSILSMNKSDTLSTKIKNLKLEFADDNYFLFYLQNVEWLWCVMTKSKIKDSAVIETAFNEHKRSFFSDKLSALKAFPQSSKASIQEINSYLSAALINYTDSDYNYFKRGDLFSLIERWYE